MRLEKTMRSLLATCALGAAAVAMPALGQAATGKMEVSAVVLSNCRLTVAPLVFGDYDPLGIHQATHLDATTELRLLCSRDSRATLSLDAGLNPDGPGGRRMGNAGELLGYQVFRDSSRSLPWGEGSDAFVLSEVSSGVEPELLTVYGRIPAGQQVLSGSYTDVVTAKVDF
jgi:spore coat protein U-like protein